MIYSIIRFKAAPDDLEDGPSIHGHTGLEIAWTAIPFVDRHGDRGHLRRSSSRGTTRRARTRSSSTSRRSSTSWTFSYPEANNATSPCSTSRSTARSSSTCARSTSSTRSSCRSSGENEDIVPGMVTHLHVTPDRIGTYHARVQRALRARAHAHAHPGRSWSRQEAFARGSRSRKRRRARDEEAVCSAPAGSAPHGCSSPSARLGLGIVALCR